MNKLTARTRTAPSTEERLGGYDLAAFAEELGAYGCAVLPRLMTTEECGGIAALYPQEGHFRSHIHMARHGFGKGEYRYFAYPLPEPIADLRGALYAHLAPIANRQWLERADGYRHALSGESRRIPRALP